MKPWKYFAQVNPDSEATGATRQFRVEATTEAEALAKGKAEAEAAGHTVYEEFAMAAKS